MAYYRWIPVNQQLNSGLNPVTFSELPSQVPFDYQPYAPNLTTVDCVRGVLSIIGRVVHCAGVMLQRVGDSLSGGSWHL